MSILCRLLNRTPHLEHSALSFTHIRRMEARSESNSASDYETFQKVFEKAKRIVVLTGAGISAESGVPTFRGSESSRPLWRRYSIQNLATPKAFEKDPSLVWQFYEWRRQLVATKQPNNAHKSLSYLEEKFANDDNGRSLWVITQNVDELHRQAGTINLIELHGSIYKTRCTNCRHVQSNYTNPIVPALANVSNDILHQPLGGSDAIDVNLLPHCDECDGLLRPHIVWFNESLWPEVVAEATHVLNTTDLLLVVGTSSVVFPACLYAPEASRRGIPVAEFNIERTKATPHFTFFFPGPCSITLPKALNIEHLIEENEKNATV